MAAVVPVARTIGRSGRRLRAGARPRRAKDLRGRLRPPVASRTATRTTISGSNAEAPTARVSRVLLRRAARAALLKVVGRMTDRSIGRCLKAALLRIHRLLRTGARAEAPIRPATRIGLTRDVVVTVAAAGDEVAAEGASGRREIRTLLKLRRARDSARAAMNLATEARDRRDSHGRKARLPRAVASPHLRATVSRGRAGVAANKAGVTATAVVVVVAEVAARAADTGADRAWAARTKAAGVVRTRAVPAAVREVRLRAAHRRNSRPDGTTRTPGVR